jgi:hypothetical protein
MFASWKTGYRNEIFLYFMDQPTCILTKHSFHSQVVMTTKESVSTNFLLGEAIQFVDKEDLAQNLVTREECTTYVR